MRPGISPGGSRGIGRAVARALAGRGCAVVISYVQDQAVAEAAVEEILAANGTALAVRADVTDELDVERLFSETIEAFGGVDIVVHATIRGSSVVDRQAERQLRRGGVIVNVSGAVNGIAPEPEPPGADPDIADLVAFLDRWRRRRGE
jgi:3-oxoacyl-[acyl-carrier protein] reductase